MRLTTFSLQSKARPSGNAPPTALGVSTGRDYVLFAHEVTFGEERLGSILIEISTRSLRNSVLNLLWTNIAFLFGGLAVTTALAYRLQRFITTPINELVEVTKSIASEQDYSTKATRHSEDEIGWLADSVNQMLEAIEKQDETLRSTNSILEKTVEKRTRDLNERNKALNKAIKPLGQRRMQKIFLLPQVTSSDSIESNN